VSFPGKGKEAKRGSLGGLSVDAAYVLQSEPGESLVLSATFLFGELFKPAPAPAAPTTPR